MSNPPGEQSNEISFEDRRQAQQQQEETEKGALGQQQQQRYHQHQPEEEEALQGGDSRAAENISSKNLISEERIFGSQFTYRDYLFDNNSNSTISAAELQPGPSSGAGNIISLVSGHHQVAETSEGAGTVHVPQSIVSSHMPSALLSDTGTGSSPTSSLLSLSVNTSILDFDLQQQHSEQQQILPAFSSQETHQSVAGAVDTSVFLLPSANSSSSSVGIGGNLVDVSSDSSLPTNEYMLFSSSMLDTTTTNLSAMQETSGTPTTATTKVVDYFSTPAPLQSTMPQESSNVESLTQQQLNQLETQHHVQSQQQQHHQQQQQESAPNFGHFRLNGNGASQHNTVVHSGEVVQVPNDTNNNPISEELKDSLGGLLLNERPPPPLPQSTLNSNNNTNSVPTTSCNMDNQVSSGGHSSTVQQYMTSTNSGQMMSTTSSGSGLEGSNGNGGPGQTMMTGQELAAQQQQQHNPQLVPSSGSNDGQTNVLEMSLPSNYPCYSDESQMQQQHAFSGSNIESAMANQQQQQSSGQVDSQMVSNDPSSLYHSHHLPPLQHQQQQQPPTPTSSRAQAQHSTTQQQQHQRPIANQQINLNHGQTMPLQQQSQPQQQQQQQQHQSQHHSMVANAPAAPSLDQYGQSQLISTSSPSIEVRSSSSATLQQQQQQSSQSSSTASVDTMTSTPQSTSVSTSSEIKQDLGSYQSTSAETYMLQPSSSGGPQSAQPYLHHQVPLHLSEGQMCQQATQPPPPLPPPPSSSSISNAPQHQQQQQLTMSTAHQRTTQHYISSSAESIHTSTSSNQASSNNGVNSQPNGNVDNSMSTSEQGNSSSSGQILSPFEQQSIGSTQSGPSSSLGQQQQGSFVYVKCEPGVNQPNTVTHYSTEAAKPLQNSVQMQYEVQTQPVQQQQQQQSRLSLNDPSASSGSHQQSSGDNTLQQMQQVPSQQQQQQQLLNQQQSQAAHDDVFSPSQQTRPPPAPLPPSSSGTFPLSSTQQQQICISLASNMPTVTMAGLPPPTSANQSGLRSVCVITDPNASTSLPTLQQQQQQQQQSSQAQVNVAATSFSPLPPKKLRYGNSPVAPTAASSVNTSVSQLNPLNATVVVGQQSTSSSLLFASKSSVTASSVLPPASSSQQSPTVAVAAPPPSSSASLNPNIVQTMLLQSNLASFNQAQSLQSQQQMQSQQQLQTTAAGNLVITSPTSVSNLQNVSIKSFVPSSESVEQSYSEGNIILHQTGQFAPSPSSMPSVSISSATVASGNNVSCYPTSGVSSSIQSGSQYSSRIQQVVSSTASVVSSQGQIFFNSPGAGNIRLLDSSNLNYSILSLQPATIQQGRSLQAHQQQQQPAQATKTVTQKIMLHSVSSSESNESSGTGSPVVAPTATPAATLISLNSKFALPGGAHQGQMTALAASALPALNNGPGGVLSGQQLPTHGIILSPVQLTGNNIPGSQASRSVANFAVPIPVVTSAISAAAMAAAGGVPRSQHLTISQAALGQFVQPTMQQFAAIASTSQSQPTTAGAIISNLSLPSTSTAPPPLATKSTKAPSKSTSKGASKSANPSSSVSISGKNIHPPPIISEDPAKPFKCVLCGKNLASKNVYQLHLRSHSGEKPFSCQLCSNRFSQKTSLTRHMRSHTGERPFPCQICNKRFADKERIKIHMRIHTGEKPFSCGICGKKFSQKSTVKRHMSVHTGVKPFKCEICGKGFANRGNLTAHTKTHQSQQANQRGSGNHATTSGSASNNNANSQQQQQQQQSAASLSRQIQSSMAPTNISFSSPSVTSVVANNGVRVEIKTEVDDLDSKSNLVIPHNHQFTSATMSTAVHSVGPQAQQPQQ